MRNQVTPAIVLALWLTAVSLPASGQEDCRDVNGEIIPNCTCTDIAGVPVSCTDWVPLPNPTVIPTPTARPEATSTPRPTHIPGADEGLPREVQEALTKRSPLKVLRTMSQPVRLEMEPPRFLYKGSAFTDYDLRFRILWSGDIQPWNDDFLDIRLQVARWVMQEGDDYEILERMMESDGLSTASVKIRLYRDWVPQIRVTAKSGTYKLSTFDRIQNKKSGQGWSSQAISRGPTRRTMTFHREIE